ncbi:MAG TPA: Uma2 family endonuclease [Gemmatimonadales bacterium]
MDEKRTGYSLRAPGFSGPSQYLPGRGSFPRVDDHLVVPELTRDEIINGRRVVAHPALPPHANQHSDLDYVLRAHAAPGYRSASDLLTRVGEKSDFATDACIYKEGLDPSTGARHLEEIAFEVVSEQRDGNVTEKAKEMQRRGVRRIFAVFVKNPRVCEWSAVSQSWHPLEAGSSIEDRCLVKPLAVAALLDAALADNAVAEALLAKGNPVLQKREAAAEAKGEARGKAASILEILAAREIAVSPVQKQEILGCQDLDRLSLWLRRAALASSADDITAEP